MADGCSFQWSHFSLQAETNYQPIFLKDQSRLHHFGKKVLPGIFIRHALHTGGGWTSDVLIAHVKRFKPESLGNRVFPCA